MRTFARFHSQFGRTRDAGSRARLLWVLTLAFAAFPGATAEELERAHALHHTGPGVPNIDHVMGRTGGPCSLIPKAAKVAWISKKKEIAQRTPGVTRKKFLYNISRASHEKSWNKNFTEPGFGSKLLAFLPEIIPKVGPLKVLALRMPTPEVETMFILW